MPETGLSERDVCTKFITPAIEQAGWDVQTQVREEVSLTAGRVVVRGKLDKHSEEIEDRVYNQKDFDRTLVLVWKSSISSAVGSSTCRPSTISKTNFTGLRDVIPRSKRTLSAMPRWNSRGRIT